MKANNRLRPALSLAAMAAVMGVSGGVPIDPRQRSEPDVAIPRSAQGNGPRCRPSNKGGYESPVAKKRRRKMAKASKRRNRS